MPRPKSIIPSHNLTTALPEPLLVQLALHLWSDLENRVPQGAYQRFFSERIQEFFTTQVRTIHGFTIRATPFTLDSLEELLGEYHDTGSNQQDPDLAREST